MPFGTFTVYHTWHEPANSPWCCGTATLASTGLANPSVPQLSRGRGEGWTRSSTLTGHGAGLHLGDDAGAILLVRRPPVDVESRVCGAGIKHQTVLGEVEGTRGVRGCRPASPTAEQAELQESQQSSWWAGEPQVAKPRMSPEQGKPCVIAITSCIGDKALSQAL